MKRNQTTTTWFKRLFKFTAWSTLVVGVFITAYLVYLDRTITETFEGRRWSVPAVVYAQPLELYPGAAIRLADLTTELKRLGYQNKSALNTPGAYFRSGRTLHVFLRSFRFEEQQRASQKITLSFDSYRITNIRSEASTAIPLIRLDPPVIGSFFASHGEDRIILTPEQVPDLLKQALKAVEDNGFDNHYGFDPKGILRALWVNVRSGEVQQGGSTLTQQLVKSYFLDNRQTIVRKLRELAMAIILEIRFSKDDLLNAYINEIFLGQAGNRAVHGFGLGAQFYFNKPLPELDTHEIATLISIIRGPSYYNPHKKPLRVKARRDLVLNKMHEHRLITEGELGIAQAAPFNIVTGARRGGAYYPAFMDLVRANLGDQYADDDLASQGLRVFTTLKPSVQDALEQGIAESLSAIESRGELTPESLQTAAVITDSQTGEVLALAGGRQAGFDGFNRALKAQRPMGSLIKPVIYALALQQGYSLASTIVDEEVSVELPGNKFWTPKNFDEELHGPVPLIRAMADSLNLATVKLGLEIGIERVADELQQFAGKEVQNLYPSLLLGAEPMTPLELSSVYGVFASGGFFMPPKAVIAVLDEQGNALSHHSFDMRQQLNPEISAAISRALYAVMTHGTGRSSRFAQLGTAGKTGTSDDFRDSWFAGYDNSKLAVVWVGHDDNSPTELTGATGALKVWDAVMAKLGVVSLTDTDQAPTDPAFRATTVEYLTGMEADPSCADTLNLTIPTELILQSKPGCSISDRGQLGKRVRSWFRRQQGQ